MGEKSCFCSEMMMVSGVGMRAPYHQYEDSEEKESLE